MNMASKYRYSPRPAAVPLRLRWSGPGAVFSTDNLSESPSTAVFSASGFAFGFFSSPA